MGCRWQNTFVDVLLPKHFRCYHGGVLPRIGNVYEWVACQCVKVVLQYQRPACFCQSVGLRGHYNEVALGNRCVHILLTTAVKRETKHVDTILYRNVVAVKILASLQCTLLVGCLRVADFGYYLVPGLSIVETHTFQHLEVLYQIIVHLAAHTLQFGECSEHGIYIFHELRIAFP